MSVVRLPKKTCDHHNLIEAIVDSGLADADNTEIKVEFQRETFMTTSALAQLCSWGLLRKDRGCSFRFLGDDKALAYPARVDLFKHLGFEYRETRGRGNESGRFIPLRLLKDRDLSLSEAVNAVCDLVSVNIPGSENFLPALRWVVQELTDNVGNHAESPTPGVLCAQLYPKKKRVEIAIADMGRGIKASLGARYPKVWSHGDAITKAMEAGVTRDLAAGQGNGLSGSHEIIMANGGGLHIWTGDADLAFERGKKKGFRVGPEFPGTGILLSLRTNHPVDLRKTTLVDATERNLHEIRRVPTGTPSPVVSVAQHCSHVGGRGPGKSLRGRLEEETGVVGPDPKLVVVDFEGVDQPSSSFLDEVFGRFADLHGRECYERLLDVSSASDVVRGMITRVVSQRLNEVPPVRPAREAVAPQHREAVGRVCVAKAAVFVGPDENRPWAEEIWLQLLDGQADDLHHISLVAGWPEHLCSELESLEGSVLLIPAWDRISKSHSEVLDGNSSVASALVSKIRDLVQAGRSFDLLLPTSMVSTHREVGLRNDLWRIDGLRTVVSFPASLGQALGAQVELSILQLGCVRQREAAHAVAMLDGGTILTEGKLSRKQEKELRGLLDVFGAGGTLGYRFVWEDPSRPLRYESHDPSLKRHEAELGEHGGTVPLRDLVSAFLTGSASGPRTKNSSDSPVVSRRAIAGRDIRSLENLSVEDLEEIEVADPADPEQQLAAGDVLVSAISKVGDSIILGVLPDALAGTVAKHGLYVLRFSDDASRDLVVDYLRSAFAGKWLDSEAARLGGARRIPLGKLQELPIPAPDGRIAKLVGQLSQTSSELRRAAENFDDQRRALFGTVTQSLRGQLMESEETSLLAAALEHGLRAVDDPVARIRLLFPLPLALAWREMELEDRARQGYDAILHVFEAAMGYLAVMLVADLRKQATELEALNRLLTAFATPRRGPTLGDWVQVLRQAPSLSPAEALESSSFPELRLLLSEDMDRSDWWRTVGALLDRRNDLAHRRGPQSDSEFEAEVAAATNDLQVLFDRLGFLARYRLTLVLDCKFDELTEDRIARIKGLAGDHPVVPEQALETDRELGRGLYFEIGDSQLTLCSPWMEYAECPECGNWEVIVPEFASDEKEGGTRYKSLRNGHMHPGRPGSLERLARFAGVEEFE